MNRTRASTSSEDDANLLVDGMDNDTIFINYSAVHRHHNHTILPISLHRTQLLAALETHGVLILVGETGCGKSTMLPQYLYENGWADSNSNNSMTNYREIICTQPRRIAAISLASHLSSTLPDPSIVGYTVRFASTYTPGITKIRYVTDGWLLRECVLLDPLLKHCSVLIIDEAHERSVNTELLLGTVKKIRKLRPELRVVICSATLDAQSFLDFFVGKAKKKNVKEQSKVIDDEQQVALQQHKRRKSRWGRVGEDNNDHPTTTTNDGNERISSSLNQEDNITTNSGAIISVDGRQYPIDIMYIRDPVSDYVKSTVEVALRIHESEGGESGDILCFLTTGEEVDAAVEMAENILSSSTTVQNSAVCLPLYSSLPIHLQSQPFLPRSETEIKYKTRRIIFATNIAETSVTVPDIAHVIDCGYAKLPFFDPVSGFDRRIVCPISRASARQRAGRAGRVRAGKCYRLYSEQYFTNDMVAETAPEIQRCNLVTLIMTIKALGVKNVLSFDLMSVPSVEAMAYGLECLYALGAMDADAELTALGSEMVYFPTEPQVSRMILASLDMEERDDTPSMVSKLIVGDILTVAAALQVRNLFYQPRTERQWRMYDDSMADILDRSGDHVTMVHLVDLVDHSGKLLSEDECRLRFVNRVAMQRALEVRNQLARFASRRFDGGEVHWLGMTRREIVGSRVFDPTERSEAIRKCVAAGYFMNVAKLGGGGRYFSLRGNFALSISSSSVSYRFGENSEYIVFGQTLDGSRGGVEARHCSSISGLWLKQIAPYYWT
ncbi:hypothetical protein ACHAWU_004513 [Discostella pseudostelligera]|uniref:RNA helicase n=1 Tax=Discostella pseudostelligera TaxID=259834 RepID=A0ABD3MSS2_9STRA